MRGDTCCGPSAASVPSVQHTGGLQKAVEPFRILPSWDRKGIIPGNESPNEEQGNGKGRGEEGSIPMLH